MSRYGFLGDRNIQSSNSSYQPTSRFRNPALHITFLVFSGASVQPYTLLQAKFQALDNVAEKSSPLREPMNGF